MQPLHINATVTNLLKNVFAHVIFSPEVETVVEHRRATSSGDSLSPPNTLLTIMVQAYIVLAGVAYIDAGTGFLLFLAVNVLANLVVLSSISGDE